MSDKAAKGEAEVSQKTQPTSDEQEKAEKNAPEESKEDDNAKPKPEGGDAQAGEPESPKEKKEEKPQLSDPEEPDDGVPILLVTGASGYLASHIIKQLLEQGRFRVRGTVRSLENEKKVKPLRDLVPEAKYPLRLIEADLLKPTLWTEAVRRCSYVFHVASPLANIKAKNPDAIIKPAVEGTTNVLKACAEAGTVKRVVFTSSTVAVVSMSGDSEKPSDHVYTEADWTNEATTAITYEKSKVRAEKAAWDFVKNLDASKQFELVTLCPGLLVGPLLSPSHKEGSASVVLNIVSGKMSRVPDVHFLVADVRDTAAAHIAALEKPEAAGNRYIVFTERLSLKEIGQIVAEEFKPQGYKISVKGMPKAAMWAAKFVNSEAKFMYHSIGKKLTLSTEKMKGELGITPRPVKESVVDVGYSGIDMGLVPKKSGYLGHPSTRPPEDAAKTASKEDAAAETTVEDKESTPKQEQKEADSKPTEPATSLELKKTEETAKEEELPVEPAKQDEQTSEAAGQEQPQSEPAKDEEQASEPAKDEEPESEPAKDEEPASEPAKDEEPQSEPVKHEEPQIEPATDEEPASEPAKDEEPASEPADEPAKQEEPASQSEEPSAQDDEPQEREPQEEQPASEPDPPSESAAKDEEPSTAAAEQEEQSEPQDTPASDEGQDEASKEADTES